MENFDWTGFTRKALIKADVQTLYNAWAIPNETEKWFLSKTIYYNSQGIETDKSKPVKAGDTFEWFWFFYDGVEKNDIIQANGNDFLQFHFAGECVVSVKFKKLDVENTLVEITQSQIPTDDQSKRDIRLGCESGWAFFLMNLKSIYEGGIDLRNKEIDIKDISCN